ncbi:recombinase family protein [Pseudaestuariivita rosea]|uniref:recombinase family protein n=1 Tax=Pseudaestuariivita rosea TaxID=2763263 RepID=UPI001ABB2D84
MFRAPLGLLSRKVPGLRNPLVPVVHIGRRIWNRLRYSKHPETGKRVSKVKPDSEWITDDVPELCIVDQDLWEAVKRRQGSVDWKRKIAISGGKRTFTLGN